MDSPEELQIMKYDAPPVWKTICEAASDLVLYIEQIDGYRVPVHRFQTFFTDQYRDSTDLARYRDVAIREHELRMRNDPNEARAREYRLRLEDEMNQNRVRRDIVRESFRTVSPSGPFNDFSW